MTGRLYVGVDAGSSATKCVVLDAAGAMLGRHVVPSGFDYMQAGQEVVARSLEQAGGGPGDIARCIATGYGREHIRFADQFLTEITCHARGARQWYPQVRNIIDIGGQDTKIIRIDSHGQMADYRMNAKCAAGTGTFLESIALKLGMTLGQIDDLAAQSTATTTLNSYCTVFAGTEVLECIKAGKPRQDICMGLFRSIALRTFEMISAHSGPVAPTGGVVAHCKAMVKALEEVLRTEVLLPPLPQFAGAYGAALLARERANIETPKRRNAETHEASVAQALPLASGSAGGGGSDCRRCSP